MDLNKIDLKKARQDFPAIAPILLGAINAWPDNIGIYISKIEREQNQEKLKQWFKFWAQVDIIGAASMVTKLKRTKEEQKEEIKLIILQEAKKEVEDIRNLYKLMDVLLYFNSFGRAKGCYNYAKYITIKKLNEIKQEKSLEKMNMLLRQYVQNTETFERIFSKEELLDLPEKAIIKRLIPDSENEKKVQEINNVLEYVLEHKEILKEAEISLKKFMHDKNTTFDSERVSMQKVIELLEKMQTQIDNKQDASSNLEKMKPEIQIFIDNLKEIQKRQEDRTKEFIDEETEKLIKIRNKEIEKIKEDIKAQQQIIHNILYKNVIETKKALRKKKISKLLLRKTYNEALNIRVEENFTEPLKEYIDEDRNYLSVISLINNKELSQKIYKLVEGIEKRKYTIFYRCRNNFKKIQAMEKIVPVNIIKLKDAILKDLDRIMQGIPSKELKEARDEVEKQLKKLESTKDETQLRNQDIKETYIDILCMKIPRIKQFLNANMDLESFNVKVVQSLLEKSKYNLIFQYIKIVLDTGNYATIRNSLKNFNLVLASKRDNKEIITKITNKLIKRTNSGIALEFLRIIGVDKFSNYLPSNKCLLDYIEELKDTTNSLQLLYVQKRLFFEYYQDTYKDEMICTEKWLEYFEKSRKIEIPEILHEEVVILELLEKNISYLENKFVQDKIEQIENAYEKNTIDMKSLYICKLIVKVLNNILSEETDLETKLHKIEKLSVLNCFKYTEKQIKPNFKFIDIKVIDIKINSNQIFEKLIENLKEEDMKYLIDIYMNTHIKVTLEIEKFMELLSHKTLKGVFESFSKYIFYGIIKSRKNSTFYSFKILNVLNEDKIRIERKNFEYDNGTKTTYTAKMSNYDSLYNRIILKDIQIYQTGKNSTRTINQKINQNMIDKLRADTQNPYKYIHYKDIAEYKYDRKKSEIVNMVSQKLKPSEKEMYYEKIKQNYKEALENEQILLNDIIYYYMNTATKYIIDLNEFIGMIADIRYPAKRIVDISNEFKGYVILFKRLDNENRVIGTLQLEGNNIEYIGNELRKYFMREITYQGGLLDTFNKETGKIYIRKLLDIDIQTNSEQYTQLEDIFTKYLATRDFSILEKLKDLDTIPELLNEENKQYATEKALLYNYRVLFYSIFSILIQDLEKLKTFLQYLGKNNFWKEQINKQTSVVWYVTRNEISEDIREVFLEKAKKENVATVLYCYMNTHIKDIIPLGELLRTMARYNPELNTNKEESIIDLMKYNIKIMVKINKQKTRKEDGYIVAFINKNLRIKLPENTKLQFYNNLNVIKYDKLSDCMICEVSSAPIKSIMEQYNKESIYLYTKILNENPIIADLYDLIEDEAVKKTNVYYDEFLESKYFYDLIINETKQLKKLSKVFKCYLEGKLKQEALNITNVIKIMIIYSNTLLRYSMQLDEFLEIIGPIIDKIEGLITQSFKIKIYKKIDNITYEVYFVRYNRTLLAKFMKHKNVDLIEGEEYIAYLHFYNAKNKDIILERPEKSIKYTNTTLFNIIIGNQVRQITATTNKIKQFCEDYLEKEKLSLEKEEKFKELIDTLNLKIHTGGEKAIKKAKRAIYDFILYNNDKVIDEKGMITCISSLIPEARKWDLESRIINSLKNLVRNGKTNVNINEDKNARELLLETASSIIMKKESFLRYYNF